MSYFPDEIQFHIFEYLPAEYHVSLFLVNRQWRKHLEKSIILEFSNKLQKALEINCIQQFLGYFSEMISSNALYHVGVMLLHYHNPMY